MKPFLIFFILSVMLQANSCYSIRILSMKNELGAEKAQNILQKDYVKNIKFSTLQKENNFNFINQKKGNYYAVQLSYFRDKKIMQEILDIIRIKNSGSFVRKESNSLCSPKEPIDKEKQTEIVIKEIEVVKKVEVIKEIEVIKEVKVIQHSQLFLILFIITTLLLIAISYLLYISKKELLKVNKLLDEKDTKDEFGLDDLDFDDIDFDIDEDFLQDIGDIK